MLNGITGAAACCSYQPESGTAGYGVAVNARPVSVGGVQINVPRSPGGLLSQIGQALDQAIHGGDNATAQRLIDSAARTYSGGANVIPFPMVNPFKPVLKARVPVSGLNRWPNRFTYKVETAPAGVEPDDEQSSFDGLSGLGYTWGDFGPALQNPLDYSLNSGPSKLQTVLGTIQATLPATIQALRANPQNIYPSTSLNPYTAVTTQQQSAPEGYYYDQTGSLRKVGSAVGGAVGSVGQSLMDFVRTNPLLVLGGGAALVLLFMNPPRRR